MAHSMKIEQGSPAPITSTMSGKTRQAVRKAEQIAVCKSVQTAEQAATHGIDFDAASRAWMENKIRRGPALLYRCSAIQKNGTPCPRAARTECTIGAPFFCTQHTQKPIKKTPPTIAKIPKA